METFRSGILVVATIILQFLLQLTEIQANTTTAIPESPAAKTMWDETWTDKLKHDLLLNYDKFARPAEHNETTSVKFDLIVTFYTMDEERSIMTVYSWVKMLWNDKKLRWNASNYGELKALHLADHELWHPDVVLYNSAIGPSSDQMGDTHCISYPSGEVLWVPPSHFRSFCDLNLLLWPFDTQVCKFKFGSWTYDVKQIDLQLFAEDTQTEMMANNSEWDLVSMTKFRNLTNYACCAEPYPDITFTLTLQRKPAAYRTIVITPTTVIILMTLIVFWLPPASGEKLFIGGFTAIVICLFLIYFSQKIPAMAGNTPLVVLFYSSSLYMISFSLIISVLVINMARQQHYVALPRPVRKLLVGWVGRALGLCPLITQVSAANSRQGNRTGDDESHEHRAVGFDELNTRNADLSKVEENVSEKKSSSIAVNNAEWTLLATAIDRTAFIVYCFLFVILALVYCI